MKRTFSKEFKVKACELVLKDGIKHAVVAEKMGINKIMLYRWIDEYETHGEEAFVGKGHQRPEDAELIGLVNICIVEKITKFDNDIFLDFRAAGESSAGSTVRLRTACP